jgi:hypothetical protein
VIYVYPQLVPVLWDIEQASLSPYVYDTLVGPLSVLIPPSAFLAPYVKFKGFDKLDWHFGQPMNVQPPALQLRAQVTEAMGWLPEFDVPADRIDGQFGFHSDDRDEILPRLGIGQW